MCVNKKNFLCVNHLKYIKIMKIFRGNHKSIYDTYIDEYIYVFEYSNTAYGTVMLHYCNVF